MLCKHCGKELPISGQFCPFCGAPLEQTHANDETAPFTPVTDPLEEIPPVDLSAIDALLREEKADDPDATRVVRELDDLTPPPTAPRRPAQSAAPRTTYFDASAPENAPYKKPSAGKKVGIALLVIVLIAALAGGIVWFVSSRRPDENLTTAEKYMERSDFSRALEYFQLALDESNDPAAIQLQIDLLRSYEQAQDAIDEENYPSALALLQDLKNRITDPASTLYEAVEQQIADVQQKQAESTFAADLAEAAQYITDEKYDAAAGKLDSLAADDTLTADQLRQVQTLQTQLREAQETAQRQQETAQQQAQQKQAFRTQIDTLEEDDKKIAAAETAAQELELTATSFEAWDQLLSDMYDYLARVLNADQYASEEEAYQKWVIERDDGAANAAKDSADETAAQLAEASFKQSYTKTRCLRLLDLM